MLESTHIIDSELDRTVDLFYYESVPNGSPFEIGGRGAFSYQGEPTAVPIKGTALESWVDALREHVETNHPTTRRDFRVTFSGRSFRVNRQHQEHGTQLGLRALPTSVPELDDLKLSQPMIRNILAHDWLNSGGLVAFCGLTGMGKTTLASATVTTRLRAFGGRCVGVEDVCEIPLEGLWNKGSCRQLEVDYSDPQSLDYGFEGAIRSAYRSFPATRPAILYVGEVRDTETATEVIKAASNGMLVITTVHAQDAATAMMRIATLARSTMGDAANEALAQALRLVVYQQLQLDKDSVGWGRGLITGHILMSDGPSHAVANQIRKRTFQGIAGIQSYQDKQLRLASQHKLGVSQLLKTLSYRQE